MKDNTKHLSDLIPEDDFYHRAGSAYATLDLVTHRAACAGCGNGRRTGGKSGFALRAMPHTALVVDEWECNNCGKVHAVRGSYKAVIKKLLAVGYVDLAKHTAKMYFLDEHDLGPELFAKVSG